MSPTMPHTKASIAPIIIIFHSFEFVQHGTQYQLLLPDAALLTCFFLATLFFW